MQVMLIAIHAGEFILGAMVATFGMVAHEQLKKRRERNAYEAPEISEWRATGQIDFVSSDAVMRSDQENDPAQFVLLMQEQRQVANIAGSPTTEIRWRYASKAEAKDVVRRVALSRRDDPLPPMPRRSSNELLDAISEAESRKKE